MQELPIIGFDTETHLIAQGACAPKNVCLTWSDGEQSGLLAGLDVLDWISDALDLVIAGDLRLAAQNTAFDMASLGATFPALMPKIFAAYETGGIFCAKVNERILDIAKDNTGDHTKVKGYYALDRLAKIRLGMTVDKTNPWRLKFAELEGIPVEKWPTDATEYAVDDAISVRGVCLHQLAEAHDMQYEAFPAEVTRQAGFDFPLYLMKAWGLRTNWERVAALSKDTLSKMEALQTKLFEAGITDAHGKKNMALIKARVEKCFDDPEEIPRTPKGAISTAKSTIEMCNDPDLTNVVEYAALQKKHKTYVMKLWEGTDGVIHPWIHCLGAVSGRTSSSNPNVQNQSREGGIRECFQPRDGAIFGSADYDSQETRTLAQCCLDLLGKSTLAKRYQEDPDFDPHASFGGEMLGIDYAEALRRKREGDPKMKNKRQEAKAANFGYPGGLGHKKFRAYAKGYGLNLTEDESKALKDKWFDSLPEMRDYFRLVNDISRDGSGVLEQVRSKRQRGGVGFCDGANSFFQGLGSDATKTAAFMVSKACYAEPESPLFGCRPVMVIHDEIVCEMPESYAPEAAIELGRLMVDAMGIWCPDVPARATPTISYVWSKEVEPTFDVSGRLIPWEGKSHGTNQKETDGPREREQAA